MDNQFPDIPKDLLDTILSCFPEPAYSLSMTTEQLLFRHGARHVALWLKERYEEQQKQMRE